MEWKPKFIQLPIDKMAGAPWNLLDHRGFRIAWCGTDGNHENDGELIANDLLNLIAMGEAVGGLHETASKRMNQLESQLKEKDARIERMRGLLERVLEHGATLPMEAETELFTEIYEELEDTKP